MAIDKEINRYQWYDQIIKRNMHKKKKAKWEWDRTLATSNGALSWNKVSLSIKSSYAYQREKQRSSNIH